MTIAKAKTLITSVSANFDGLMKYSYEVTGVDEYMLTMHDCKNDIIRHLSFVVKKMKSDINVHFTCHGFKLNFPLKKNVESFVFDINDFIMLIKYGVKVDKEVQNPAMDLDVEF